MKKFVFVLIFSFFLFPSLISAKSIADLRNDLDSIKSEKAQKEANAQAIQDKINAVKYEIEQIGAQIEQAEKDKENTEKEIEELEKEIDEKKEQIKDLIIFHQISSNKNFYLEYIFGADSFTDLIYRTAIIEQLTHSNDELIDEMNDLIDLNNAKIKELEITKKNLQELSKQAEAKINSLGNEKSQFVAEAESYDGQISSIEKQIKYYEDLGCGETESFASCLSSKGESGVPPSYNGFISPVSSGVVTDDFGWRYLSGMGGWNYHSGIDIGGNSEGTRLKAVADGRVSRVIVYPDSGYDLYGCGGQQVYINHIVNGKYYTSVYKHLLTINVSVGDVVNQGDIIGTQGGGSTSRYDRCTFGTHLHLSFATGHYYGIGANSYYSYSTYSNNLFEPRDVISYPSYGQWFYW